jgi:hypothetical protein
MLHIHYHYHCISRVVEEDDEKLHQNSGGEGMARKTVIA